MRVNFGFLCDRFSREDGKPSAEGVGLDAIYASGMPVRHPGFDAVINMRFGSAETGEKTVGLGVTDQNGSPIAPARYEVMQVEVSPGQIYQNKTLKITVAETEFLSFGDYQVVWLLEGLEIHNLPFKVLPDIG